MKFGNRIRQLRRSAGLGIKAIAKKIEVDHSYLSRIESGQVQPSEVIVQKLAKALVHDEDELMLLANRVPRSWRGVIEKSSREATSCIRESLAKYESNPVPYKQHELFENPAIQMQGLPRRNGSSFDDPAFATNKNRPIHRWVPWIAGFSSDFVKTAIDRFLTQPGTILDPFAGVGTTLVDAISHGHNAIGFEINPYAALACRVKTSAWQVSPDALKLEIFKFRKFCVRKMASDYSPKSSSPEGFKTRSKFYSPKVLRKVLIAQDFIRSIKTECLRDMFRLAFAATMVSYSNYSYEPSLGRRSSAGKDDIHDFPVEQAILGKLTQMADDVDWIRERLAKQPKQCRIFNDSFFAVQKHLPCEVADIIITSPPYLNNYHYNRNTRPQMYWLDFVKESTEMKQLEESNFGKYWQTVRDLDTVSLNFKLPGTDLEERIEELGALNSKRGIYGGRGWANYASTYFNDCYAFAKGIRYVLRHQGRAVVVIGNSILQGVLIPTDQYFGKIAESLGLELVGIEIPRKTRVGNSIIKSDVRVGKAHSSHQLYEAVVELRKR